MKRFLLALVAVATVGTSGADIHVTNLTKKPVKVWYFDLNNKYRNITVKGEDGALIKDARGGEVDIANVIDTKKLDLHSVTVRAENGAIVRIKN